MCVKIWLGFANVFRENRRKSNIGNVIKTWIRCAERSRQSEIARMYSAMMASVVAKGERIHFGISLGLIMALVWLGLLFTERKQIRHERHGK